jgi:uncharacterized membrane protein YphA (DoxX/SURF4 family)
MSVGYHESGIRGGCADDSLASVQRLYSTFPDRWPGVGLLLLRVAIGSWAAIEGGAELLGGSGAGLGVAVGASVGSSATVSSEQAWWIVACAAALAVVSGMALLIGFLTPIAGLAVALLSGARALSWIPPPIPHLLDNPAGAWFMAIVAVGVALLGPGAFSLDSYLFGRREIVIPPAHE